MNGSVDGGGGDPLLVSWVGRLAGDTEPVPFRAVCAHHRPVRFADELVVYADEQGASVRQAGQEFAIGLMFGPHPVDPDVVSHALDQRSDAEGHGRCLRRDHFHASEDCLSCRQLVGSVLRALPDRFFVSLRWAHDHARPTHPTAGDLHRHALTLALNQPTGSLGVRRVRLLFEGGARGMSVAALDKWLREEVDYRLRSVIALEGAAPTVFPIVDVEEVDKNDPGVQLCDHLLWRERRELSQRAETLADVGYSFRDQLGPAGAFTLRRYAHGDAGLPVERPRPLGSDPADHGQDKLAALLGGIEMNVHWLAQRRPPELAHLERWYVTASRKTQGKRRLSFEAAQELYRAFLLLVDTVPLYDSRDPDQAQAASDAARIAAIMAAGRETRSVSMTDWWWQIRESLFESGRQALLERPHDAFSSTG